MFRPLTVRAALFTSAGLLACMHSGASAQTLVWNTATGQVTGALGSGSAGYAVSVDAATGLCTWSFDGDLHLAPGTVVRVEGQNRAAIVADNIYFGSPEGGAGIVIDASATASNPGPGGGWGGQAGQAGTGQWDYNAGHGGAGGAGGNLVNNLVGYAGLPAGGGGPGQWGQAGQAGGAGGAGLGAAAGATAVGGAGGSRGMLGYNYTIDEGGRPEYHGAPGSPYPGTGGAYLSNGTAGRDADHPGQAGGAGGAGQSGAGGHFAADDPYALAAGGGGSGGQGSGGGGGAGGGGGGAGILVDGNPGGPGGRGGHGGRGGDGGSAGAGGHGGGAASFTARGLMQAYVPVQTLARGSDGAAGSAGQAGSAGEAGQPGQLGGQAWYRGWGGDGGDGMNGGQGGSGGRGGDGGAGAGGTVLLAGSVLAGLDLSADCGGGNAPSPGQTGQAGRLVLGCDAGTLAADLLGGSLVTGSGAPFGLHGRAVHLGSDAQAPRLVELAEGIETSGILARSAGPIGMQAGGICPVVARRSTTPDGHSYSDYDVILIAAGQQDLLAPMPALGGWASSCVTGAGDDRRGLSRLAAGEVYAFLAPKGTEGYFSMSYGLGDSNFVVDMPIDALGQADLTGCKHSSVFAGGLYDCAAGPRAMARFATRSDARVVVRVTGAPADLLPLLADQAEIDPGSTVVLDFTGYEPTAGETYCFLRAGAWAGQFGDVEVIGLDASLVETDLAGGTFTIVPEPASAVLLSMALAAGLGGRRKPYRSARR